MRKSRISIPTSAKATDALLRDILLFLACCAIVLAGAVAPLAAQDSPLLRQSKDEVARKSRGCLGCHGGIEPMHRTIALGCTDCHGGNADATAKSAAHVQPRHPEAWKSSANPQRSYTLLNRESPEFIRFFNPGDLRVADLACGGCHAAEVYNVRKSIMTTSALLWGGAAYNNGIVSTKQYIFGESYSTDGVQQQLNTVPPPTAEEMEKQGILPTLLPLPRWEITQPGDIFRSFERGGRSSRANPSEIGNPNPTEEPGKPDNKLSARGPGTELRISSPVLNIHKTRLNDPHLSFLGTNDHPGDYRSSGCTSCHVVYANDRSPVNSGPYARFGNRGYSRSGDTTIPKNEPGHPILHQFTNAIPSSQCVVCHMHQPNSFVNTYLGYQMWDYETDGEQMYPKTQSAPSAAEAFDLLSQNPEGAVLRGKWGMAEFLAEVTQLNPALKLTQFADYHGHGWIFRAVFKKDRKGNLLDKDGARIPDSAPDRFTGVVPLIDKNGNLVQPAPAADAQRAVHLKDIHAEKGMHCVDCHFKQDAHGTGKLVGEFHNAVEVQCIDCHGDYSTPAPLRSSGVAASEASMPFDDMNTPFGERRFRRRGKTVVQRSVVDSTLSWEVSQTADAHDPASKQYNEKAAIAHLMTKAGVRGAPGADPAGLAHSYQKMECQSCHTSWVTNCFGCHLPMEANWKKSSNHFEGETSRNWTTYNPQVLRDDGYMLGLTGTTKGGKITSVRSSSALVLSSRNANREQIYLQQAPISAAGYSSQAFNPHFAHTVRKTETRACTDCHLSSNNDNNAWMAQLLLLGTNFVNFVGKYAYVAAGEGGVEAVEVTETEEPQAVIGSYLHSLAYPDWFKKHVDGGGLLNTSYGHGGTVLGVQLRGEYLYAACGSDGFRVFDVANIDNKGYSERIISAPVSPLGQSTRVRSRFATAVALPTTMPIDTRRTHRPENREQWPIHPIYSHAFITDAEEGLIVVDVMTLSDGDPRNNFLERAVTFNPGGKLDGAVNIAIAGNTAYICCTRGLVAVDISDPLRPAILAELGAPFIRGARAVAVQFRYAFVCDAEGVKVIDVTLPGAMQPVKKTLPLAGAQDVYLARTYAYVAAGRQGLAIIDAENPENLVLEKLFSAGGLIDDARGVKVGATNAGVFAYVADGKNGLRVIQLISPADTPGHLGFSPAPTPKLIATRKTAGTALAISKGMDRDRAVDESGNQVSVFGRLGSRPFTLEEMRRMYMKDGKIWTVSDDGKVEYRK